MLYNFTDSLSLQDEVVVSLDGNIRLNFGDRINFVDEIIVDFSTTGSGEARVTSLVVEVPFDTTTTSENATIVSSFLTELAKKNADAEDRVSEFLIEVMYVKGNNWQIYEVK